MGDRPVTSEILMISLILSNDYCLLFLLTGKATGTDIIIISLINGTRLGNNSDIFQRSYVLKCFSVWY